jgi:hypothetical protein
MHDAALDNSAMLDDPAMHDAAMLGQDSSSTYNE